MQPKPIVLGHGALCYDTVALLNTGEYLYTLAVALAERHLLLAVAFGVYLHVDEVDALLLGEGGEGRVMTFGRSWVMRYISA